MLPTLSGRIQSRIFFLATIGSFWTFIMCLILPAQGAALSLKLRDGFVVLLWVAIIGVAWECLYHFVMQWRWEKDWPTFFGFITFLNEGILIYLLADNGKLPLFKGDSVPFWFFWPLFLVVWMAVWLWVNGPMRVFNLHWRFFGGRLI